MKDETLLGPWVRRFLLEHLVAERNLARNTQVSYRDTLALLLPFASKHGGRAIDRMTIEDPQVPRPPGTRSPMQRCHPQPKARDHSIIGAVHRHGCAEIRATPFKKTAKTGIGYLEKAEMDALLAQPDRRTPIGDRDHALLLFLYNSGARADEAARLTIDSLVRYAALRLIKIAARVVEMKTMIRVHLPTSCPVQDILRFALGRIPRLVT